MVQVFDNQSYVLTTGPCK